MTSATRATFPLQSTTPGPVAMRAPPPAPPRTANGLRAASPSEKTVSMCARSSALGASAAGGESGGWWGREQHRSTALESVETEKRCPPSAACVQ